MEKGLVMWFEKTGDRWVEALPIGNGRLGGMVYGGIVNERIDLSETTCYSGKVEEGNKETAKEFFLKSREALIERDFSKLEEYAKNITGIHNNYGTNLPIGFLNIKSHTLDEGIDNYKRSLCIDEAVAYVELKKDGIEYKREFFTSNPDQVMAMKLSASKEKSLSLSVSFNGGENPHVVSSEGTDIILNGNANEKRHSIEACGVHYYLRARILTKDGRISNNGGIISVKEASEVVIYITANTTFNLEFPEKLCIEQLAYAQRKGYAQIKTDHIKDYKRLFNRVSFDIECNEQSILSTQKRLEKVRMGGEDYGLTVMMFHYARYLLISSTRENSPLPAHLQGVWNDNVACRIGWTCDMHLDINTQMNYWPSLPTNLFECTKPLYDWIENILVPSGRHSAEKSYSCKGWVAHTVSNPWGFTAPGGATYWGFHVTGGAWIATHLWEHYKYIDDINFLREHAYWVIKGVAEFFLEYMFIDPKTGYLVTGPSHSPENQFIVNGEKYSVCMMPTCDIAIINEIFDACIEGAKILNIDESYIGKLEEAKGKLPPYQIGKYGQLQEWMEDYEEAQPNHRHTSHLLGIYPFSQITPEKTPTLAKAASVSLERRMLPEGSWEDTCWARALLLLYAARLWDGDEAYRHILEMQRQLTETNLFVMHPPVAGADEPVFEMDGLTGLCVGLAEMFVQSYDGEIHILPALPSVWSKGHITGLRVRGGYEIDIHFSNNSLEKAVIIGKPNSTVVVKYNGIRKQISLNSYGRLIFQPNLVAEERNGKNE